MANILSAQIPAGQAYTGPMGIGSIPVMMSYPISGWDPAPLTVSFSPDGGATWVDLFNANGTEYQFKVIVGSAVIFVPAMQFSMMMRLRSGSRTAPVPQSAARNFQLILYP